MVFMFIKGFPLVSKQKEPRLVFHLFLAQTFKYLEIHDYLILKRKRKNSVKTMKSQCRKKTKRLNFLNIF